MDYFSCSPLFYLFIYLFIYIFIILFIYSLIHFRNKLPEVPEYAKMQFNMMTLFDVLGKIA